MIDVVFLLLFFFLMVTRFGSREGMLPARLPGRAAAAPAIEIPRVPIRIRFVTDPTTPDQCQVSIDRFHEAPMEIPALASALASIRDNEPGFDDTSVQLVADDDVAWDHVVNAYNAGLAAGYEKIYFVGSP